MIPIVALLFAFHGEEMEGVRLAATGALEKLDQPSAAPLWRDGQFETGWRSQDWGADVLWRTVRRWDRDDAEVGLRVSRNWGPRWRTEFSGSKGFDDVFLASWSVRSELEALFPGDWVLAGQWKVSDFAGFELHQPDLRIERYLGAWRLGMVVSFPWYDGATPQVGGKASFGWDWSDAGGLGFDFGSNHEMERRPTVVVERKTLTAAMGLRQKLTPHVVTRLSAAWTSLEGVHERVEVRLGFECFLGN